MREKFAWVAIASPVPSAVVVKTAGEAAPI
jgi:hypothetical protein